MFICRKVTKPVRVVLYVKTENGKRPLLDDLSMEALSAELGYKAEIEIFFSCKAIK